MKVYDNTHFANFEKANSVWAEALRKESRIITISSIIHAIEMCAFSACVLLGIIFDHEVFRFLLPASFVTCALVVNTGISAMKVFTWKRRLKAQEALNEKSKTLSTYNTDRVLELMAAHEIIDLANKGSSSAEFRTVN